MIYLELFWAFFQIGLFSIGGGYAAMPLIQNQVVELHGWLTMSEFSDVVTISQMTPGPIAINSATFVGTRIAGFGGAVIATVGCVFPSFFIVLLLAMLYRKYGSMDTVQGIMNALHPAVVGLIASAGYAIIAQALTIGGTHLDGIALGIFLICLLCLKKTKLDPTLIILGAGALGGLVYGLT